MMRVWPIAVGAGALYILDFMRQSQMTKLSYFSADEFGAFWPRMSPELLAKLDALRGALGYPIVITQSGRLYGTGYHNPLIHGTVQAVDVQPISPTTGGALTRAEAEIFVAEAARAGFGGTGVYPYWLPRPGFHLDVGPSGRRWGDVMQYGDHLHKYIAQSDALAVWT